MSRKNWFLNQCWILGAEMDDDVVDQQKYASAAMVLALALVDAEKDIATYRPQLGHMLPEIPLRKAREIMTRSSFICSYYHTNLFTVTSSTQVRADSVPMQRAFRMVCSDPGFREHLQATLDRINEIESLGRIREIVANDLVRSGRYSVVDTGGGWEGRASWRLS
jgi:hypothetical protein